MTDDAIAARPPRPPSAGPAARLVAKPVALHTFHDNVVILARDGTAFRAERPAGLRTVELRAGGRGCGTALALDCLQMASIARPAGAPTRRGAGIDLLRKGGDEVRAGEPLYRIHGAEPSDFRFAVEAAAEDDGMRVGP